MFKAPNPQARRAQVKKLASNEATPQDETFGTARRLRFIQLSDMPGMDAALIARIGLTVQDIEDVRNGKLRRGTADVSFICETLGLPLTWFEPTGERA